jgi:hypothetical protein
MTERDAANAAKLSEFEDLRFKRSQQRTFSKGFQQATPSGATEKLANSKPASFASRSMSIVNSV